MRSSLCPMEKARWWEPCYLFYSCRWNLLHQMDWYTDSQWSSKRQLGLNLCTSDSWHQSSLFRSFLVQECILSASSSPTIWCAWDGHGSPEGFHVYSPNMANLITSSAVLLDRLACLISIQAVNLSVFGLSLRRSALLCLSSGHLVKSSHCSAVLWLKCPGGYWVTGVVKTSFSYCCSFSPCALTSLS